MAMKSGVPGALRRRVFRRDGYACQECGLAGREVRWGNGVFTHPTSVEGVYLSIDHVHPKSLGGTNDPDNLRTLCTTCNTRKGTKVNGGGR
jgi:5-methylcytosine-specific restriction endonuclease McrA